MIDLGKTNEFHLSITVGKQTASLEKVIYKSSFSEQMIQSLFLATGA